jgi:hypothetical protein
VRMCATRIQLAAVFALIDADTCGIITLQELVSYMRGEGFRVSAFRFKATTRETDKARRALSEIFDHVVEVMVCWDLHGNNSTTLIDVGRGLRFLKIKGLDVNKVISEASADVTVGLTDGVLHLKDFVRHFTWHPLEPLPELVARYEKTKLQRAVVMGKVRAWKARQHPDHIDPDLGTVCCKVHILKRTLSVTLYEYMYWGTNSGEFLCAASCEASREQSLACSITCFENFCALPKKKVAEQVGHHLEHVQCCARGWRRAPRWRGFIAKDHQPERVEGRRRGMRGSADKQADGKGLPSRGKG